ncbi:phasin family protein [Motiliproteus sp. MSK22-1]|uniref:phasin family protein n=1 Tax=Motiliproteus sp. MSK22-1 TaxID=1897630 RepID=UPI000976FBDD|nr:phasin family protein [Motiliproteus sp. MSK22-1]OMH32753.1 hypothetical protein BGP75_14605 [Motiliproteus sp. MSK22-1]
MYESFFKDVESSLKPAIDMAAVNQKALAKLTSLQAECINECVDAQFKQFQALSKSKDPQSAVELQISFIKDFEAKVANTAELNVAAINDASEAIKKIVNQGLEQLAQHNPLTSLFSEYLDLSNTAAAEKTASTASSEELKKAAAPKVVTPTSSATPAPGVQIKKAAETNKTDKKTSASPVSRVKKTAAKKPAAAPKPATKKGADAKPAAKKAETVAKPGKVTDDSINKAAPGSATQNPDTAKPTTSAKEPQKAVKSKAAPTAKKSAPARAAAPMARPVTRTK